MQNAYLSSYRKLLTFPHYCGVDDEDDAHHLAIAGMDFPMIARFLPEARPMLRTNSVAAALSAAKAGMGLAPLPCGLADLEPDLVRIAPLSEDFSLDLWLLTHEDLRQTARIRAFLDFLAEALAREAPLLEGLRPGPIYTPTHAAPDMSKAQAPSAGS